jgi:hypothetical protein
MGHVRGKKSGIFTPLDFAFMSALGGILFVSPMLGWGFQLLTGAFSTSPG